MITARMNRLFGISGNCFDVAIDHGMFNEQSFLPGIENMDKAIRIIAHAKPDAIQLPPGTAKILQSIAGKDRPALVLRTDIANIYGNPLPKALFSELIDRPVAQALALDAACVVVNLLMLPDQPEVYRACLRNVSRGASGVRSLEVLQGLLGAMIGDAPALAATLSALPSALPSTDAAGAAASFDLTNLALGCPGPHLLPLPSSLQARDDA